MWDIQRTVLSGHRNVLNSIVFLNSLAPVQISSQSCVQMELFGVVGAPKGEVICQYWSVPVQFRTLCCDFVGHSYFHNNIPPCERPWFTGWLLSSFLAGAADESCVPGHLWCFHHFHADLAVEQEQHELFVPCTGGLQDCVVTNRAVFLQYHFPQGLLTPVRVLP